MIGMEVIMVVKTSLDKQKALRLINNFLDQYKNCCNQKAQPNPSAFKNILAPQVHNVTSGKEIGKNVDDILNRIKHCQKEYTRIEFDHIDDCLIADDKAIIQYNMKRTAQDGKKDTINVMAVVTIEDNLITQWSMVSHEK